MLRKITALGFTLALAGAAPAMAQPTVTITTDKATCTARVTVQWTGKQDVAGVQVNVDNVGRQDTAKQLNNAGDTLVKTPGSYSYEFVLAQNAAHAIDAWTQAYGVVGRQTAMLDCTTPVPPTTITVEVPVDRVVERVVPGPERLVPRLVRKYVIHYRIKYRTRTRTLRVCPRPRFAG